jgi:hypothetical protein
VNHIDLVTHGLHEQVFSDSFNQPNRPYLGFVFGIQEYYFAQTVITKYHRLGSLKSRNLFFHSSGGWRSKIQMLERLVTSKNSLGLSSVHMHPDVSLFVQMTSS